MATIANLIIGLTATSGGVEAAMKRTGDATEMLRRRVAAQSEVQQRGQEVFNQTRTASERYATRVKELADLCDKGAISYETYTRAMEQAKTSMQGMDGASGKAGTAMDGFHRKLFNKTLSVGAAFIAVRKSLGALADELERVSREGGEGFVVELQNIINKMVTSIPIIGDLTRVFTVLITELDGSAAELRSLNAELAAHAAHADKMQRKWAEAENIIGVLKSLENQVKHFGEASEIATLKQNNASQQAIINATLLLSKLEALENAAKNAEMIADLEHQVDTFGMSADAVALYEAALRGATEAELAHMAALQQQLAAMQAQADLVKASEDLLNRLQEQIDTFGMSANEIAIWKLAQQGATEETLNLARALDEQLKAMQAQEELMRKGKQVFDQTRTPAERLASKIEELQKLLDAGAISWETFQRAISAANQEFQKAQGLGEAQFASTVERRMIAGFADDNQSKNAGGVKIADPLKSIDKNSVKWIAEARQSNVLLREQNRLLEDLIETQDGEVVSI